MQSYLRQRVFIDQIHLLLPIFTSVAVGLAIASRNEWLILIAVVALLILIMIAPFLKSRIEALLDRQQASQLEHLTQQIDELRGESENAKRAQKFSATQTKVLEDTIDMLSDLLRECVRELKGTNDTQSEAIFQDPLVATLGIRQRTQDVVQDISRQALSKLQTVFNYPDDRDARVTFFRLDGDTEGQRVLTQYSYSYPPALSPHTQHIRERDHPRCGAFRCVRSEDMFTVSDIPAAAEEAERGVDAGWEDFRAGQHREYGSMVCYPVITGRPREDGRRFVGVITVTVKARGYFQDNRYDSYPEDSISRSFTTRIIHPFALILGILAELERATEVGHEILQFVVRAISEADR